MTAFTLTIDDAAVKAALNRLSDATKNMTPALKAIGEVLYRQTKQTFATSTDPWGKPWEPNKPSTLASYLAKKSGAVSKQGGLTKKGKLYAGAKKPLIGDGRFLSGASIHHHAAGGLLTLSSSAVYAAIHQFGGQAGRGRKMTLPARPFLPVTATGELSPKAQAAIHEAISAHLMQTVNST